MTEEPAHPKSAEHLEMWRIGIRACRRAMRRRENGNEAGEKALLAAYPGMSAEQAKREMVDAVAWVTRGPHCQWFWSAQAPSDYKWPPKVRE